MKTLKTSSSCLLNDDQMTLPVGSYRDDVLDLLVDVKGVFKFSHGRHPGVLGGRKVDEKERQEATFLPRPAILQDFCS